MKKDNFTGSLLIVLLCFTILLNSCSYSCTDATSTISLIGFLNSETDTVIVRKFSKSTNFTTILDTFLLNNINSNFQIQNDTLKIIASYQTDNGLLSRYNYEVYLPKIKKLYQISEIKEEYRSINTGFNKVGCINSIDSYKINGKLILGDKINATFFISK